MESQMYRLELRGALHLGVRGLAREGTEVYIPSDTLMAALMVAWARQGLALDTLAGELMEPEPALTVSSAFPYGGEVRFYPHPLLRHRWTDGAGGAALGRARWVSEGLFQRLAGHQPLAAQETALVQDNELWLTREEMARLPRRTLDPEGVARLWKRETRPRVTLDRASSASQVYQVGRANYAAGCGLWFAARAGSPIWRERLEAALSDLADSGLGGLRSIGHGAYRWSRSEAGTLPAPPGGEEYLLTLSRYAPGESESEALLAPRALYRLAEVGGWAAGEAGDRRRRSVRLVAEGSLLRGPIRGSLVDVTPAINDLGHPVWRWGLAFGVAVNQEAVPGEGEGITYG